MLHFNSSCVSPPSLGTRCRVGAEVGQRFSVLQESCLEGIAKKDTLNAKVCWINDFPCLSWLIRSFPFIGERKPGQVEPKPIPTLQKEGCKHFLWLWDSMHLFIPTPLASLNLLLFAAPVTGDKTQPGEKLLHHRPFCYRFVCAAAFSLFAYHWRWMLLSWGLRLRVICLLVNSLWEVNQSSLGELPRRLLAILHFKVTRSQWEKETATQSPDKLQINTVQWTSM